MKINILIILLVGLSVFFTGCSGRNDESFIRPYDKYENFSIQKFRGKRVVKINAGTKDVYEWAPAKKISGFLTFEFIFNTNNGVNQSNRQMNFSIKSNENTILSLDFDNTNLREYDSHFIFRRAIKTAVSLGVNDKIRFSLQDSSPSVGDNFDLINLKLIPEKGPDHKKNKNILLITIDTLRADYLGYYRKLKGLYPDRISFSPNLDRIADDNLIFTKAYTPISSTWPALSSIAQSRMPFDHGVQRNGEQPENRDSSLGHHLFNKWYSISYRANAFQLDLGGFDVAQSFFRKDKKLKNRAKGFLVENYKKKFFLWLHFLGVHSGYRPPKNILSRIEPEEYTGSVYKAVGPVLKKITAGEKKVTEGDIEHIRNCYAGELLQLDEWLQEIFEVMKEKKIWDNTLIIISADHGEDLYQHNNHFFHHPSIYNTSLHVPLVIKFPNSEYKGVIDQNVSLMDFMPTILDYFNIETEYRMTGESLMPLIKGEVKRKNRYLFAETETNKIMSIIDDNWKFIYNPSNIAPKTQYGNPYPIGVEEFYNLKDDRLESNNIFPDGLPNIYKKLKYNLFNYINTFQLDKKKKTRKKVSEMSEEVKKELRTLGYL